MVYVSGDRVGDALIKLPVIKSFRDRFPKSRLIWVTGRRPSAYKSSLSPLAATLIDEIHEKVFEGTCFPRWSALLKSNGFDAIVCTESRVWETLSLRHLRCRRFVSPALRFLLSDARPSCAYEALSVFERFKVLMNLATGVELAPTPCIEVPTAVRTMARQLLPEGRTYIGLCPGAGGARKRWPLERFVAVAREQVSRGNVPVFFLGPEEQHLTRHLATAIPEALFPEYDERACSYRGPMLSIALGQLVRASVANDSGGGHLLAAAGQPVITLFGHTSPAKFRPPYGCQIAIEAITYGGTDLEMISVGTVVRCLETVLRRQLNPR